MAKKKVKEVLLMEKDGAVTASRAAFKAAAIEARRVAVEMFLEREDVSAAAFRDLGSLFMLCTEHPGRAIEYGCGHIRENSPMFRSPKNLLGGR